MNKLVFSTGRIADAETFTGAKIDLQDGAGRLEFQDGSVMFANSGDTLVKTGDSVKIQTPVYLKAQAAIRGFRA